MGSRAPPRFGSAGGSPGVPQGSMPAPPLVVPPLEGTPQGSIPPPPFSREGSSSRNAVQRAESRDGPSPASWRVDRAAKTGDERSVSVNRTTRARDKVLRTMQAPFWIASRLPLFEAEERPGSYSAAERGLGRQNSSTAATCSLLSASASAGSLGRRNVSVCKDNWSDPPPQALDPDYLGSRRAGASSTPLSEVLQSLSEPSRERPAMSISLFRPQRVDSRTASL